MKLEERQELAGHLQAELLDARHQYNHGRMSKEAFQRLVEAVRKRRLAATAPAHHTATIFTSEPMLPLL